MILRVKNCWNPWDIRKFPKVANPRLTLFGIMKRVYTLLLQGMTYHDQSANCGLRVFDLSGNEKSPDHSTGAIKALAVKQVHGTRFWKRVRKDEPFAFATSRLDSLEARASKPE